MKFVRYSVNDFGDVYSTYVNFFSENNLSKKFYNYGADILPPKVAIKNPYSRNIDGFDKEVEEANSVSFTFLNGSKDLEKILQRDWILVGGPFPHSDCHDDKICVIMKDFRVGENKTFSPYCRLQKLLVDANTLKEQDEFECYNNVWENI